MSTSEFYNLYKDDDGDNFIEFKNIPSTIPINREYRKMSNGIRIRKFGGADIYFQEISLPERHSENHISFIFTYHFERFGKQYVEALNEYFSQVIEGV
jgi:hypothetical protein